MASMNSRQSRRRKAQGRNKRDDLILALRGLAPANPPSIDTSVKMSFVIRYQMIATANGTSVQPGPVDFASLLVLASTSTLSIPICTSAVKIRKIEMWGSSGQITQPITCAITWFDSTSTSSFGGPGRTITDTSVGATGVAFVSSKPPKNSHAGQYNGPTDTLNMVQIDIPPGAVIDFHLTYVISAAQQTSRANVAVVGATAGLVYAKNFMLNANLIPQAWITA